MKVTKYISIFLILMTFMSCDKETIVPFSSTNPSGSPLRIIRTINGDIHVIDDEDGFHITDPSDRCGKGRKVTTVIDGVTITDPKDRVGAAIVKTPKR